MSTQNKGLASSLQAKMSTFLLKKQSKAYLCMLPLCTVVTFTIIYPQTQSTVQHIHLSHCTTKPQEIVLISCCMNYNLYLSVILKKKSKASFYTFIITNVTHLRSHNSTSRALPAPISKQIMLSYFWLLLRCVDHKSYKCSSQLKTVLKVLLWE